MTTFPTNYVLRLSALDPAFEGTPQEYAEHLVDRLEVRATSLTYGLSIWSALPVSNEGPGLLDGDKLYVWDEGESKYVPADITDSLDVKPADKYVLVSDAGVWGWKLASELWAWSNLGIGNLVAGAAGTIAYSDGTLNKWGIPDVALPAKSVAISKLKADPADAGKFPQAQADGTFALSALASVRGQVLMTAEYAVPAAGQSVSIPRPAGAVLINAFLRAKATPLFLGSSNFGWSVGEEVRIEDIALEWADGARTTAFSVAQSETYWKIVRHNDAAGDIVGQGELPNRESGTNFVQIQDAQYANWKLVIQYL